MAKISFKIQDLDGGMTITFLPSLLAAILPQKAYLRKSVVLPSTLTLQLDELGDEYEDSAELMASISIESKVKDKPINFSLLL